MSTTIKVALISAAVTVVLMRLAAHTVTGRKFIIGSVQTGAV